MSRNIVSKAKRRVLGQGMTEYIIIVALIAIAAIGVFTAFGDVARDQVAGMATELSGQDAGNQIQQATQDAQGAQNQAGKQTGLGAYNGNQQ